LAAAALGDLGVQVTIGTDPGTAAVIESKGAKHINCSAVEIVVDTANRVVTTPAYMLAANILEAEAGINKLVSKLLELA
jgi:enhancing lycopene biosynthesis protein 2